MDETLVDNESLVVDHKVNYYDYASHQGKRVKVVIQTNVISNVIYMIDQEEKPNQRRGQWFRAIE